MLPPVSGRVPRCVFVVMIEFLQGMNIFGMPLDQDFAVLIQWLVGGTVNLGRKFCHFAATQFFAGRWWDGLAHDNNHGSPSWHDSKTLKKYGSSRKNRNGNPKGLPGEFLKARKKGASYR